MKTDLFIAGGGVGGCAAALAACEAGYSVVMSEPTAWIGGQFTQQAVPPDENLAMEQTGGGTRRYHKFRDAIRQYYRDHYPLTRKARFDWRLNPGDGFVCGLCHEPRVSLAALEAMLAPYRSSRRLLILTHTRPVAADRAGDIIKAIRVSSLLTGRELTISADYFLDATELGDLLPLTDTEFVSGFESQAMTGEPSAPDVYEPDNMQAISWCFAMDHLPGEDNVIDRPERYEFWRKFVPNLTPAWSGPLLSWQVSNALTRSPLDLHLMPPKEAPADERRSLWRFRRIASQANFEPGFYPSDITLVNWPQIDYFVGPVINRSVEEVEKHFADARQLSLSLLYWLQTEAPHPGGVGFPGLRLRSDVTGDGPDGLAQHAYIRESRRINAEFTVCEQHLSRRVRGDHGAEKFADSVGIGHYNIDIHPSTGGDNYLDTETCPFQIPLRSLLPVQVENLLPAAKNLGVTHMTNGCYRLHPVEWNIGEAAGSLAVFCLSRQTRPRQVAHSANLLQDFQTWLANEGVLLQWPDPVRGY